jgi:hypothetical protein
MFAILIAAGLGGLVRYASREGRSTYGVLLVPAVAAAATAMVWELLVWLGWTFDGGWIWLVALAAGPLVALAVALVLPNRRSAADRSLLVELSRSRA